MTPASRSTLKWWVVVDLLTGRSNAMQAMLACPSASSRTMVSRTGSASAWSTVSRRISAADGWASRRPDVTATVCSVVGMGGLLQVSRL
ncbi:hypothetical protein SMICM17S_06562 [Streptomyces microflavus]